MQTSQSCVSMRAGRTLTERAAPELTPCARNLQWSQLAEKCSTRRAISDVSPKVLHFYTSLPACMYQCCCAVPLVDLAESFQGLSVDFSVLEPHWWLPPRKRPSNATSPARTREEVLPLRETSADVDVRIKELLVKLKELPEQHIAIVGHSSFFKRMLGMNRKLRNCELCEVPFAEIANRYAIDTEETYLNGE